MIKVGDNVYRNLEEQVQKNKEDIANHWNVDRVLADFGIKVLGKFDYESDLNDPSKVDKSTLVYGDGYLVGLEAPYNVYVWTRANIYAGEPDDYFLNIGSISIVGPAGPEGPQGPAGPQGESSKWYANSINPSNTGSYKEGDMYLRTTNGQVFRFQNSAWQSMMNIKGPQGIQGVQGPRGEKGDTGPQGPQGEKGDVGGFINIVGQLSNVNQLPLPSTLDNLTYAYLVAHTGGSDQANDHYDLYIQVGETSDVAVWVNVGPFNVATLVTVNGSGQNVWNADTKLDRNTSVTTYNQVYVKAANGGEGYINVTKQAIGDAVVQRTSTGQITVPVQAVNDTDAVSLKMAQEAVVSVLNAANAYTDTSIASANSYTDSAIATALSNFSGETKLYSNSISVRYRISKFEDFVIYVPISNKIADFERTHLGLINFLLKYHENGVVFCSYDTKLCRIGDLTLSAGGRIDLIDDAGTILLTLDNLSTFMYANVSTTEL